jgi:signal transduction histidine kinase/ligand-binding sensor domain-containing protein/DNA-binding response OmpR family regulator
MKKRIISILSFLTFLLIRIFSQEQPVFRHYSVEDGLSQNTVMAILQDSKGFMWFGTWDGLNKFDGYKFTIYKSRPGDLSNIPNNRIDYLHEDRWGNIWFQTYDGKFHRFNTRTEQFFNLPFTTNRYTYNIERNKHFCESKNGELWIGTAESGVVRVTTHPKTFEITTTEYSASGNNQILSNTINFIFEDSEKNIWIGNAKGLNNVNPSSNQINTYQPNGQETNAAFLSAFERKEQIWFGDDRGYIWIFSKKNNNFQKVKICNSGITGISIVGETNMILTSNGDGIFVYNISNHSLTNFSSKNTTEIRNNNFLSVEVDSYNVAWIEGEQEGVFRYRQTDNSLKYFKPRTDEVSRISILPNFMVIEDVNKKLWINPQGGGFSLYNREKDQLEYFYNEPFSSNSRFSNIIHSGYSDRKGNLWLCTYNKGLEKISFYTTKFHSGKVNNAINSLTANEVRAMAQLSNGNIIIATKDGTIRFFNEKLKEIGILSTDGTLNGKNKVNDLAYCILEDSKKNIWIGTKGTGVIKLIPENQKWVNMKYKTERYVNNPLENSSLSNDNIYSIIEDDNGRILIGTFGGGLNVVTEVNGKTAFLNYKNKLNFPINTCSKIRHLLQDKEKTIWVATTNGLLQIDNFMTSGMQQYYHEKIPGDKNSLSNNDVHYLLLDNKNNLWIGTFGGGLNKLTNKASLKNKASFENYSTAQGFFSDIVLSMRHDDAGNLWLASENGITRFEPETKFVQNYDVFSGTSDAHFSEAASMVTRNGLIYFGSNLGYYYFNPYEITPSTEKPVVEFTAFQLFNIDVKTGEKNSPLKTSIGTTDVIELTHKQSVFSIEYAALDFTNPEKIQYAFMLENFENEWNYVGNQRKATYTNLPKGTYYFKVKSTNNEGVWVENERMLKIKILPSFWETYIAYLLYFVLALLLLYMVYYLTTMYSKLKNEVEVEQKVTDIKLRFFTNISHELRTPLTLITGPVENILKTERITESARDQLQIVKSNADRMLRLINQILDFRKIQNKKMRLKIQPTRFDVLLKEICSNFSKEALDKNINFKLINNAGEVILWVDRDKTDMIFYNLLSNAIKFTPENKKIEVIIDSISAKKDIQVQVKDEGPGIPREKRNVLYERFTSANEIQTLGSQRGSGIGLNLVKELVDLHKGQIEVESETGKGTTFTVTFYAGKEHFGSDVDFIVEDDYQLQTLNQEKVAAFDFEPDNASSVKENPLILIVEDNDEMRNFLTKVLSKKYRTETAADGMVGWEKARKLIPDLIITDLMMPEMDGIQLTDAVKKNEHTSHIPVILLTAKSADESRLAALKTGADDYITKPFSPVILLARVENMLEQRKRLQELYRKNLLEMEPSEVELASQDEIFMAKLLNFMEKNIDNSELTVDDLVSEMAYGRTVFFNKLKGLTGLAPIEFVRQVRIKRAAQLLKSGQYNISQITYMVGMSDSRYFSKCFKKVYGVTPSEFKKEQEKS